MPIAALPTRSGRIIKRVVADVLDRVHQVAGNRRRRVRHRLPFLPFHFLQLDEPVRHRVEGVAELAEQSSVPMSARLEVALGDRLGRALKLKIGAMKRRPAPDADHDDQGQNDRDGGCAVASRSRASLVGCSTMTVS